jgi:hypothetical protein
MWEPGALVLGERFRVVQTLGRSSAAEAYVAEQVSLGRKVVLKLIRSGHALQDEVKQLAAVDHPAVVRVLDSVHADGVLYLVTDWVEGAVLSAELKGEPLLPERALELLTQVCEGLAAVHEKNLVHGDLKPQSVVLVKTPRGEQARLDDFGTWKLVESEAADARATMPLQTVQYFAPEQATGAKPSAASDVYAFGALAYHVLSGAPPAPGQEPQPLAKAAAHLLDQFKLCELVMKCLEKDPAARPSPTRELWRKLAALPRPAEPTLFLEAMQRPPELPPAKQKGPPELMPSVPMLTVTPSPAHAAAVASAAAPGQAPKRWPLVAAAGVLLVLMAVTATFAMRGARTREARRLIEMRQPAQAMEIIAKLQRHAESPRHDLNALKAAALHLQNLHRDELAVFQVVPAADPAAVDPLVLAGLVEDFGTKEDSELRKLFEALPREGTMKAMNAFVSEPVSARQWGALRWLDTEHTTQGLKLVELYSISLESSLCPVRRVAALRLKALDDDTAVDALMRLRETPSVGQDANCGQEEAALALQALKRGKPQ